MAGVWNHEERTVLMILNEDYPDLTREQRHDIFYRIFDHQLRSAGRRYQPQDLQDQWKQRNAPGRQIEMWNDIDTASPDPAQRTRVASMRAIQTHAARSGATNFVTGQVNQPIALGNHVSYVPVRGRPAGGNNNSTPAPSSRITRSNAPKDDQSGENKRQLRSSTARRGGEKKEEPGKEEGPRGTLKDMPMEVAKDTRLLRMVHFCEIFLTEGKPTLDTSRSVGPVAEDSKLYQLGGPVAQLHIEDKTFDVIVCVVSDCTFCSRKRRPADLKQRTAMARAAESNSQIEPEKSGFYNLPFVHRGRDCKLIGGVMLFRPQGWIGPPPKNTVAGNVLFDDRYYQPNGQVGQVSARDALLCKAEECPVCMQAAKEEAAKEKVDQEEPNQGKAYQLRSRHEKVTSNVPQVNNPNSSVLLHPKRVACELPTFACLPMTIIPSK
ncbi:Hypothetical predicted protein [Lecanosticta acicola]|uniref:Uncharacterized protein n=1 Tax=Lecanosticta acicola TaxID=111012 RepID=A0AAI8Z5M0_9PEZI|nr:Hypothetical predicted protein [Lecanosticta acicola]